MKLVDGTCEGHVCRVEFIHLQHVVILSQQRMVHGIGQTFVDGDRHIRRQPEFPGTVRHSEMRRHPSPFGRTFRQRVAEITRHKRHNHAWVLKTFGLMDSNYPDSISVFGRRDGSRHPLSLPPGQKRGYVSGFFLAIFKHDILESRDKHRIAAPDGRRHQTTAGQSLHKRRKRKSLHISQYRTESVEV